MKKRPTTATAYAKVLYMAGACHGAVHSMTDHAIIDTRVRAFVDGVAWAKRQAYKRRRTSRGGHNG